MVMAQIVVPPPDAAVRLAILHALLRLPPSPAQTPAPAPAEWLPSLARDCVGYVAADLQALVREALVLLLLTSTSTSTSTTSGGSTSTSTSFTSGGGGGGAVEGGIITEAALRAAMERVGASALRGRGLEVPHVPWAAIGR